MTQVCEGGNRVTLALAAVVDLDCVVGFAPLVLDVPNPTRYARGAAAILRRALYVICDERRVAVPILALKGYRFDADGRALLRMRRDYEGAIQLIDYVQGCSIDMKISATGRLTIPARIQLVDGRTYALEVTTGDAPAAIRALGSTT